MTSGVTVPLQSFLRDNGRWLGAGSALMFLSSFGQTFFISIFAGQIRAEFGLSHGDWGAIYSLGTTASAIVMVWAGTLTDVHRARVLGPLVLTGLAVACLGMALSPWAALLPVVIFLLRFFGQGMSSHIAVVSMARWFVATRGRALSVASLGISVGEAFLPLIFVAAMAVIDWRVLWVVAAAIALLGVPLLGTLLRQERTPQSVSEAYAATGMFGQHWTRKSVITHPLFWMLVPMMLGPSAFNTAFFFHQVHLAELKGWEHVDLVALFPLYTVVSICAMIVSGWALDRYGAARLMPGFLLPLVVAFLIFSGATTTTAAALGLAVFGLSTGAMSTLPNAFWAEVYGTGHIGAIKSMVAAVMVFGSAIGPGITGYLIDLGIGLEVQFLWIAGYFVLASLMMAAGIKWARRDLITD